MKIPCDFDPDKGTITVQVYDIQIVKSLAPNEAKRLHTAIKEAGTKQAKEMSEKAAKNRKARANHIKKREIRR